MTLHRIIAKAFDAHFFVGEFPSCIEKLSRAGVLPASGEELAEARLCALQNHLINTSAIRLAEGVVYPAKGSEEILLVSRVHSPALKDPEAIFLAENEQRTNYTIQDDVFRPLREYASKDAAPARQSGVLLIERPEEFRHISTQDFAITPVTQFVFGAVAGAYGSSLFKRGIREMDFYGFDSSRRGPLPFATMMCIDGIDPSARRTEFHLVGYSSVDISNGTSVGIRSITGPNTLLSTETGRR